MTARAMWCSARPGGFGAAPRPATLDGTNGFRLDGIDCDDPAGFSVLGAGDVNGDGFADLIVGAPAPTPGGRHDDGESYVVFGKPGGFGAAPRPCDAGRNQRLPPDGIDRERLQRLSVLGAATSTATASPT